MIHLSDTHFGVSADYRFGDAAETLPRVERVVEAINGLDFEPDFIVHTGDVTNDPERKAYERAAEVLGRLRRPMYCVAGNHDDAALMREYLPLPKGAEMRIEMLVEDERRLAYVVEFEEILMVVLDGCRLDSEDTAHGELPEPQFSALHDLLGRGDGKPFAVFVHFPLLPIGSPWIDKGMLMLNGERLHGVLVEAGAERCRGVFCGHMHHPVQVWRDGIFYSAVGSACCQIRVGPRDERAVFEGEAPVYFNHVRFGDPGTVVRQRDVAV